jgi:hypothetical protein
MLPAKFAAIRENDGFDPYSTPPWLMVPVRGVKRIRLLNAPKAVVTSTTPGVATVEEVDVDRARTLGGKLVGAKKAADGSAYVEERFRISRGKGRRPVGPVDGINAREFIVKGYMAGRTYLEARINNGLVARVEVSCKRARVVRIAFNFVRDNAGHQTSRNPGQVDQWLHEMNEIYTPQANIICRKNNARWVNISKNLGAVVRYSSHLPGVSAAQHEWDDVAAKRDGTADFNYFFVWEYEQDASPGTDNTDAGALEGNCIFEDAAGGEVSETLAHELGHYLGVRDFYENNHVGWLMYGYTDVRGRTLPRDHALTMNP